MYEQDGENCPLKTFRTYLSKLNGGYDAFYQSQMGTSRKLGFGMLDIQLAKQYCQFHESHLGESRVVQEEHQPLPQGNSN